MVIGKHTQLSKNGSDGGTWSASGNFDVVEVEEPKSTTHSKGAMVPRLLDVRNNRRAARIGSGGE